MTMTSEGIAIPLGTVLRHELDQAKRLGYKVEARVTGAAAVVRLVPSTQRTKRIAAKTAPDGTTAPAIQALQTYELPRQRIEAVHSALTTALRLARDADA